MQQKDLNDLIKGKWLSDVHIHAAGVLFKRKNPGFPLQIDIHQCKTNVVACENTIQLYHDGVNHQLVSAKISGVVNVYDSIYQRHHNESIKSLLSLFHQNFVVDGRLRINYPTVQKQLGSSDCGLFATAFAIDLAEGNDPRSLYFSQTEMRNDLFHCFKKGGLECFPQNKIFSGQRRQVDRIYVINYRKCGYN